ncbi:histidine phosphatase family protein, partial [Aphanothece microscopica]|uniref:histidine phosphatase family protein n=1 Tax=Aphanothece microscopica TaxID=1049561 RepID=UPI003CE4E0C9
RSGARHDIGGMVTRRHTLLLPTAAILAGGTHKASADDAAWAVLREGGLVLFRHAIAPGGGDPAGMRLGDCATQRNLDAEGRAQARRIGDAFRAQAAPVGAVLTSRWCRTRETADLAFPGLARDEPAFDSFFADRRTADAQTAAARDILLDWTGPGALVVVTHQVNITALTASLG